MTWVKIDDRLMSHPKILALGDDTAVAITAWLAGLTWANNYLTDGAIPATVLQRLTPLSGVEAERGAAALERVGLWERTSEGWVVHDYLEYQPSRKEVERGRALRKARAKKGAATRWSGHRSKGAPSNAPSNGLSNNKDMPEGASAPPEGHSKNAPSAPTNGGSSDPAAVVDNFWNPAGMTDAELGAAIRKEQQHARSKDSTMRTWANGSLKQLTDEQERRTRIDADG